jgi:hypothetical protein
VRDGCDESGACEREDGLDVHGGVVS